MNVLSQPYRIINLATQDYLTAHSRFVDTRQAVHAQADRHHSLIRSVPLAFQIEAISDLAHAGIWGGGLYNVYQQALNNELTMIVSLVAFAGVFILWLLDNGYSRIKQNTLRGFVSTMALISIPVLWSWLFNKDVACIA